MRHVRVKYKTRKPKGRKKSSAGIYATPGRVKKTWVKRNPDELHEPVVTVSEPTIDEQRYARHNTRMYVLRRDDYKCRYCGKKVTNDTANMDHVIPWKLGGKSVASNLVTACRACNKAKGNKHWVPKPLDDYKPKKKPKWSPVKHAKKKAKLPPITADEIEHHFEITKGRKLGWRCKICRLPYKRKQIVRHWNQKHRRDFPSSQ